MNVRLMSDLDLQGKTVVFREDLNVPVKEGKITSDKRIRAAIPSLRFALDKGAGIIVLSHLGRPEEGVYSEEASLAPVAKLEELLGVPVRLEKDYLDGVSVKPGECVLCENVRFNKGEKKNNEEVARKLAALGDVYVMDAFATAHRAQASTEGAIRFAKVACVGLLMAAELEAVTRILHAPKHPLLAIIGGSKVSTKLEVLNNLSKRVDKLIVGGGIANTFLKAAGYEVGKSLYEPDLVESAAKIMEEAKGRGAAIPLPVDVVVGPALEEHAPATVLKVEDVRPTDMILDIGPATAAMYAQLIAEAGSFMSANIHAPVSGTVTAVDMVPNGQGLRQMMITIKREGDDWAEGIDRSETIVRECTLSAQEIVARIKDAGIVGMGGATFPTHVKLSIPPGKKAESLIINGVECEPYLTSDHRTMLEHGEELLVGVTILMKAIAVEKAYIGIENNKPDAIAHLRRLAQGYKGIEVVPLKVKYPQGGEKQLIVAITGREVPPPPALPIDVGAVVCNASTTYAVYQAVQKHKPLIERVVTITGKGVREPKNLLTRMGTPVEALIEAAGGLPADAGKVINGGPMMGRAMVNLASPVTKGCSGITVMSGRDAQRREASQCIKCAKCVAACPMGLEPYYLSKMTQKKGWEEVEAQMITSCIECGCCQASCPSYLPLLDWVRLGKQTVMGIIRARAAAPKK